MKWPLLLKKPPTSPSSSNGKSNSQRHATRFTITTLPNELLITIFSFAIPPEGAVFNPPPSKKPIVASQPFTLSNVCSRWRLVAKGAPLLWASVTITKPDADVSDYPGFLNLLTLHLDCSHPVPLSIRIPGYIHVPLERHQMQIFEIIRNYSHRLTHLGIPSLNALWKTIPLGITNHTSLDNHPEYTLPILESIAFNVPFQYDAYAHGQLTHLLKDTHFPNLKELDIQHLELWSRSTFTREFVTLPYTQLQSLAFVAYNHIDLHHILSCCPALKNLDIKFPLLEPTSSTTPIPKWYHAINGPISLPELETFSVTFPLRREDYESARPLFTLLESPSLRSLKLSNVDYQDLTDLPLPVLHSKFWNDVASFASVGGKVVRLNLDGVYIDDGALRKLLLASSSSLRELDIQEAQIPQAIRSLIENGWWGTLRDLADPEMVNRFVPLLRNLRMGIRGVWCSHKILPVVEQVVLSRPGVDSVASEIPDGLLMRSSSRDLAGLVEAQKLGRVAIKVVGYPSAETYIGYGVKQDHSVDYVNQRGGGLKLKLARTLW